MASASASVSNVHTGATGPNVSSRKQSMSGVTPSSTVGAMKRSAHPGTWTRDPPVVACAPCASASATWVSALCRPASSIIGPICVPAARPSPTFSAATAAVKRATNSACTRRCTRKRLAHTQVWPALRNLLAMAPATALSRSASSNTMNGACPPSSSDTRTTLAALLARRIRPTSVLPVKLTCRTVRLSKNASVMPGASSPVTTLRTPAGKPASTESSAMASAESGVCSAGFTTCVQPAASAGPILRVTMATGKFHGVIAAATPQGWRSTSRRLAGSLAGIVSP